MGGKGPAAKLAAVRHAAAMSWKPFRPSEELFHIEIIACCNKYIWASDCDAYVVMRDTENGPEMAVRGTWKEARPVWDVLVLAHEQLHKILTQYSVPETPPGDESPWVPFEPTSTVRVRETSCCGQYEWASQGGVFFVLQRTADGLLETSRGQYRSARQEWDRLVEEHRISHLTFPRKAVAHRRGKAGHPSNEASE